MDLHWFPTQRSNTTELPLQWIKKASFGVSAHAVWTPPAASGSCHIQAGSCAHLEQILQLLLTHPAGHGEIRSCFCSYKEIYLGLRLFTTGHQTLSWFLGSKTRCSLDNKFQVALTVLVLKKGMMMTKRTKNYDLIALVSAEAIFHQKP